MRTPPTACPRCNSQQSFPPLNRPTTLPLAEVLEQYIRCTMCRWEMLLLYTTKELLAAQSRKRRLALRAQMERRQHGTAQYSTQRALERMVRHTGKLTYELHLRVQEAQCSES